MKKTILLVSLIFLLVACGARSASSTPTPEVLATIAPTVTETPNPTTLVIVTGGASQEEIEQANTELGELTRSSGLTIESRETLQISDLRSEWKLIVFLQAPADINTMANAAPQTIFIVLTYTDQIGSGNITYVRLHPEYQAFIAGYITMLISEDWRGAGLLISDDTTGGRLAEAFQNGAHFYCGTCSPAFPPYEPSLPIVTALPSASDANAWLAAVEPMITGRTFAMYVMADAADLELMNYLASLGLRLLGSASPEEAYKPNWVATILLDPWTGVSEHWVEILSGGAGLTLTGGVTLADIDEAYLGQGKQRLIAEVIQQLTDGMVYPYNP